MSFAFTIHASEGRARTGTFSTPHGDVETPAFMPVGTLGTVKALDPHELRATGATMVLANAYHLHLRPGDDLIRTLGGIHRFMGWDGPVLTDSGGFQVFSLATLRRVSEEGVEFRSHIDGSVRHFTPESVMRIEANLGADVIMQFDHVVPGQSETSVARDASERSLRWLTRCRDEFARLQDGGSESPQTLFPIVQGGIHAALRRDAVASVTSLDDWSGYGIGGLSVGESKPAMYEMVEVVDDVLPLQRPRYLMGVGFPEDLVEAVRRGVDLFDCVAPTRMGRNAAAFTSTGRVNIRHARFRDDPLPLDELCGCSTCGRFSRAYLRHLFASDEMLGPRLLSLHNVHFLAETMRAARVAIRAREFEGWSRSWLERYTSAPAHQ
ncbi:MAG TPA: tRNA guanosine(34) transglycosylase Tgt [Gemmatimonadaceae bacterium]|nr:tRNA guanosine(34) transglycosylase Tgt [Gemmatimonadaceae bacterium]